MRRFNPEKELRKIQNGNRNRIILFVISLLVVSVVSYSFALYQVRYSKRIIYTKVAPFSNKDIELAVNIKGEGPSDKFPTSDELSSKGIKFTGMFCDNDDVTTTATWNSSKGGLDLFTSGPNKCTVNFGKTHTVKVVVESHGTVAKTEQEVQPNGTSETFTVIPEEGYGVKIIACTNNQKVERMENTFKVVNVTSDTKCTVTMSKIQPLFNYCIENEQLSTCLPKAKEDLTLIEDDTKDNNIRYFGTDEDVHNYIWFNCNSYEGITIDNAESEKGCEKWRIIGLFKKVPKPGGTTEDLVKIIRASSVGSMYWDTSGSYGSNNWNRPAPLRTSLISYYNGSTLSSAKGITSATQGMIEKVTWNIGGQSTPSATAQAFYNAERGSTGGGAAPTETTWDGYIGLIYPSDYGYATGGGSKYDRQACLNYSLGDWNGTGYKEDCSENDWLLYSGTSQWTLTPSSSSSNIVFNVTSDGRVNGNAPAYNSLNVRPSLYLKSTVKIKSGTGNGTKDAPYTIGT